MGIVDMFSKWIEAVPCRRATAAAVANALVREIIPRWGLPSKISSDNGRHLENEIVQSLSEALQNHLRTHCANHSRSVVAVERATQFLKMELVKLIGETSLTWEEGLPLALMRGRTHTVTGLSPHEVLTDRPMRMTNTPFPQKRLSLQKNGGRHV